MLFSSLAQGPKCDFKVVILHFRERIDTVIYFFHRQGWLPSTFRARLNEYTLESFVCTLMKFKSTPLKNTNALSILNSFILKKTHGFYPLSKINEKKHSKYQKEHLEFLIELLA
jgi:hypothetical protein